MEQKTKKKKSGVVILIFTAFFAMVFGFSAFMLVRELIRAKREEDAFVELSSMRGERHARTPATPKPSLQPGSDTVAFSGGDGTVVLPNVPESAEPGTSETDQTPEATELRSEIVEENRKLYEMNGEFFAWITIPDTNIDYPVMYSPKRPNFYLVHDFYGKSASTGVPYLDEQCDPDGTYYLVYGHRPASKTMFYHLVDFMDPEFWETHRYLYFDTLNEERTYEIVAAIKARVLERNEKDGFRYYAFKKLETEEEFDEYMDLVRQYRQYDTGVEVNYGDELLVLSTCYKYIPTGRFVLVAKRISD